MEMFSAFDKFIIKNQYTLTREDWEDISKKYELSVEMMRLFQNKLDWLNIARYQTLSMGFIREFINYQLKNYMDVICRYQELTNDFIEEFKDTVDWDIVIENQNLSTTFVLKHLDTIQKFRMRMGVDEVD